MTRKQALMKAIEALKDQGLSEEAKVLTGLWEELPNVHWTEKAIFDAVDQWIIDHGRVPKSYHFKGAGLPSPTVIKYYYKMPVPDWLDKYYPVVQPTEDELREKYTKAFIEDYLKIKPRSGDEFNAKRSDKSRGWRSVAKYYHLGTWRTLIRHLELPCYFDMRKDHIPTNFQVQISHDYDFQD